LGLTNLDKFDTNNLLITLSVIPLIDAHYSLKVIGYCSYVLSYMYFSSEKLPSKSCSFQDRNILPQSVSGIDGAFELSAFGLVVQDEANRPL
jgi:hypothetical protein